MKITIDDVMVTMQPDSIDWQQPRQVGTDGNGAPIYSPYWSCSLGFSVLVDPKLFEQWYDVVDGTEHDLELPCPYSGRMTTYSCYVHMLQPRMDVRALEDAATSGCDITLSKIEVT